MVLYLYYIGVSSFTITKLYNCMDTDRKYSLLSVTKYPIPPKKLHSHANENTS